MNNNYFTISGQDWSALAQSEDAAASVAAKTASGYTIAGDLNNLQALVDGLTAENNVLDLEGKMYNAPDISEGSDNELYGYSITEPVEIDFPITIKNGAITGTRSMQWTADGDLLRGSIMADDPALAFDRATCWVSNDSATQDQLITGAVPPTNRKSRGDRLIYLVDYNDNEQFSQGVYPFSTNNLRKQYTTTHNPLSWWEAHNTLAADLDTQQADIINEGGAVNTTSSWSGNLIEKIQFKRGDVDENGVFTRSTDPAAPKCPIWQDLEQAMTGKSGFGSGTTAQGSVRLYIRAGPNATTDTDIIDWDPVNGLLTMVPATYYRGYSQICLAGHEDWLKPGQFMLDMQNKGIVMRPFPNGRQDGQNIEMSILPNLFDGQRQGNVTFENILFAGTTNNGGSPSMLKKVGNQEDEVITVTLDPADYPAGVLGDLPLEADQLKNEHRTKLKKCRLEHGAHGTRGDIDLEDCYLNNFREYSATCSDGCTMTGTFFGICERWENLTVFCQATDLSWPGYSDYMSNDQPAQAGDPGFGTWVAGEDYRPWLKPVAPNFSLVKGPDTYPDPVPGTGLQARLSRIENCVFHNPITTHGQGLSIYNSAWSNSITRHCIFVDITRSFSAQARRDTSRRNVPAVFDFSNNIYLYDNALEPPPGGQQGWSYNGNYGDQQMQPLQADIDTNPSPLGEADLGAVLLPAEENGDVWANPDALKQNVNDNLGTPQRVLFYNNTFVANARQQFMDADSVTCTSVGMTRMIKSHVFVANNLFGYISPRSATDDFSGTSRNRFYFGATHFTANNVQWDFKNQAQAWGTDDLPNPVLGWNGLDEGLNTSDTIFDYERMRAYDAYQTLAADGGVVGHRWGGNITAQDIRNLCNKGTYDLYWPSKFPALPTNCAASGAVFNAEDLR